MPKPLALLIFGFGCLAIGSQVHFVREFLTLFVGNELSLGSIFAAWFCGIAIGAWLGNKPLRKNPQRACNGLLTSACWMPLTLVGLAGLLRFWRFFLELGIGQLPSWTDLWICSACIITPFGFFIGLVFPLACQVAQDAATTEIDRQQSIGRVYVIEAFGAIVGGVLVSMVLPGLTRSFASLGLISLPLLVGLSWMALPIAKRPFVISSLMLAVLLFALPTGVIDRLDTLSSQWRFEALGTGTQRIAFRETAYQHLDLSQQDGQYTLFSNGQVAGSFPDPYTAPGRAHLILCQHPDPKHILYLGPTYTGFAQSALRHNPTHIDIVEFDPQIFPLVQPYLPQQERLALQDRRVTIHTTDGRRFLRQNTSSWDIIFSDLPDPTTANLNRFYTIEFFQQAANHLGKKGVFATRLSSNVNLLGKEANRLVSGVYHSLRAQFAFVEIIPGEETFFLASQEAGLLLSQSQALSQRYQQRGLSDPMFNHYQFTQLVQDELVVDLKQQLIPANPDLLNQDQRPITYLHSLMAWSHMTQDAILTPLAFLIELPGWIWFALVAAIFLCLAGFFWLTSKTRSPAARSTLVAIFLVGALGMAVELMLSFTYQALAGSLYQEIGLIVAIFMCGLTLGGLVVLRRLKNHPAQAQQLVRILLYLAGTSLVLPWLLSFAFLQTAPILLVQIWLLFWVFVFGLGSGAVFPLASVIAQDAGLGFAQTATKLQAWDHLGAAFGSAWAGLILIPVLGNAMSGGLFCLACTLTAGLVMVFKHLAKKKHPESS